MATTAPVVIIGAGIVGLSTAYQLSQRVPRRQIVVLEKEPDVCLHQSGRNSGVLHSGIYYKPGSLKAQNCRAGKQAMEQFCLEHAIPYEICGKVIIAVTDSELPILDEIYRRGIANGVACERIGRDRLAELEPAATGIKALHVPETGIVDFTRVGRKLAELLCQCGCEVRTGTQVIGIHTDGGQPVVETNAGAFHAAALVNCAGLYSDRIVALCGRQPTARIVPFRGEYYRLDPPARHLCRNLIYPVPDPKFPFLGVHFTRMIEGDVECGPNAVLAWAREGYRRRDICLRDMWETVTYPGFLKVAARYWRVGAGEMHRSLSKRAFVTALQRLVPAIRAEHLVGERSGVRAQAIARNGRMVDDFLIEQQGNIVHVCNAPSPAATSSLNIGRLIADRVETLL